MESSSVEIWGDWQGRKSLKISDRFNLCLNSKDSSSHANKFHPSTLLQTMHGMRGSE